jgi:hypothetical protein
VIAEVKRDPVPDILEWEDYKLAWPRWEDELNRALNEDSYHPQSPMLVEVAKDAFATRPTLLLRPKDRVLYEALVEQFAPIIDGQLNEHVYSARLRQSRPARTWLKPQVREWLRFQKAGRDLYTVSDYAYALTTDVASYFEYIQVETLIRDLKRLPGVQESHVNLLSRLLNELERSTDGWGLPQGPEASAILGNFYLLPVDQALSMQPVRYLRFQDDLKVFADSPAKLRLALRDVIRTLRHRRLNLSVHKTKMLVGDEILTAFEDDRKTAIQYGLNIGDEAAIDDLRLLFDDAVEAKPRRDRDIRFSVYRLEDKHDPHAVGWILDHLADVPYLAPALTKYLSDHMSAFSEIEVRVTEFLKDPAANLYPFMELHLVRMLARADHVSDRTHTLLWGILRDRNKETYVREHAARAVGRHPRSGDLDLLKTLFATEPDPLVRRALLVACHESGGRDPAWLATLATAHEDLKPTCDYLMGNPILPGTRN